MASGSLARRPAVEGIGERSLPGTLTKLLQLTCDAVLVFDGAGTVLLANTEADALLGSSERPLAGIDVRLLFSLDDNPPEGVFDATDLPFGLDGQTCLVPCRTLAGSLMTVRVRADLVQAPGTTYLACVHPADAADLGERQFDRTLRELRRANRRLSGALTIVLDTIDSDNVNVLFERILEEVSSTMEADGTLVYLAEPDGFHLRGVSGGLAGERLPRYLPQGRGVEAAATRIGHAIGLRVSAPSGSDLRQGRLTMRDVVNEETHEVRRMRVGDLPPFTSFVAVPVWFGGRVISILEVGWRRMHPIEPDDLRLLDSVAHYLSVQLVSGFAEMRAERVKALDQLGVELRERLLAKPLEGETFLGRVRSVFEDAAGRLGALPAWVEGRSHQRLTSAALPRAGTVELPWDADELSRDHPGGESAGATVLPVDSELSDHLRKLREPPVCVVVDLGDVDGRRVLCLLLRPDGAEPFDEVEHDFLTRLAQDVRGLYLGEEEHEQDKRISQALQSGMRNELQRVDGLSAQAVYSSATTSASVGGDFYDLIRLPGRRACVIMGDVSGKGVEAASVSAAVKTALGAYSWEGLSPAHMVRLLNDFLLGFSRLETFATLFVGIVDLGAATLTYCSAGHPPAIMVRSNGSEISILDVQSGVVGAFADLAYEDGVTGLAEGDVLLLYTDGTTEARDPSGAFFGEQGLRDLVMRECGPGKGFDGFVERLLVSLEEFTGQSLEDDVALVAVRFERLGPAEGAPQDGRMA